MSLYLKYYGYKRKITIERRFFGEVGVFKVNYDGIQSNVKDKVKLWYLWDIFWTTVVKYTECGI